MIIIPKSVKKYGNVKVGGGCIIGEYVVLGYPYVESKKSFECGNARTLLGNKCIIGSHVVIYEGVKIGDNTNIEDFCRIGEDVTIGKNCYIIYGAKIYGDAEIGDDCIIAGFCCERAKIGNGVRLFGELLHTHREPHLGWNDVVEESPRIENSVFIGFGAKVIGGICIGKNSYITAGAIVTKDVPPQSVALGVNNIISYKKWKGELKNSKYFIV